MPPLASFWPALNCVAIITAVPLFDTSAQPRSYNPCDSVQVEMRQGWNALLTRAFSLPSVLDHFYVCLPRCGLIQSSSRSPAQHVSSTSTAPPCLPFQTPRCAGSLISCCGSSSSLFLPFFCSLLVACMARPEVIFLPTFYHFTFFLPRFRCSCT